MLIRSQNKRFAMEITGATVKVSRHAESDYEIVAYGNNLNNAGDHEVLGTYCSHTRAQEVLQDIMLKYRNEGKNSVFEMPKE